MESLGRLKAAGLLPDEPGALYREWLQRTLEAGLTVQQIVQRARVEGVTAETFTMLDELEVVRDRDGRPYVRVKSHEGARTIARLVELLNGGTPSATDPRRSANDWSYDGPLWMHGDVALVLNGGGAVVATPEGILMAAPGPKALGLVPSMAAALSFAGGTTWGELFVLNDSYDDPAGALRGVIEGGAVGNTALTPLLRHERIHSEQWAREGYVGFLARYLAAGKGCKNRYEREAGLVDGGYHTRPG
jgi:hypothetical protein